MLRKRTRSIEKDQHQMGHLPISDFGSDVVSNLKNSSFYSVPGLLLGSSSKGLSDSDSVRSPTSPLDFRVFSNLGNSFRSSRSSQDGQQRSWGSSKVGLSIVDSLDEDMKFSGKVLRSSDSKNILFGPGFRIRTPDGQANTNSFESPKSLPKNYAIFPHSKSKSPLTKGSSDILFEIGESPLEPDSFGKIRSSSLDSCRTISCLSGVNKSSPNSAPLKFCLENKVIPTPVGSAPQFTGGSPNLNQFSGPKHISIPGSLDSGNGIIGSLSTSEIELSEDYTCVISHGPNPKTTHIFGDCILETHSGDLTNPDKNRDNMEIGPPHHFTSSEISAPYPSNAFLSFCYSCNKKLEGKDIYMYRGEKAFCSLDCRSLEILNDEKLEKSNEKSSENPLNPDDDDDNGKELFETGFIATT
ncbi:hypothetical protein UlMin_034514 [Ulmus minor]